MNNVGQLPYHIVQCLQQVSKKNACACVLPTGKQKKMPVLSSGPSFCLVDQLKMHIAHTTQQVHVVVHMFVRMCVGRKTSFNLEKERATVTLSPTHKI